MLTSLFNWCDVEVWNKLTNRDTSYRMRCALRSKNLNVSVLQNTTVKEYMRTIAQEKTNQHNNEPFTVTNISSIVDQINNWKEWFGSIEPYFALKAQNNPVTQRLFHRLGLGYDCASLSEILNVRRTGCSPSKIIVSHPFKSYDCIRGWCNLFQYMMSSLHSVNNFFHSFIITSLL